MQGLDALDVVAEHVVVRWLHERRARYPASSRPEHGRLRRLLRMAPIGTVLAAGLLVDASCCSTILTVTTSEIAFRINSAPPVYLKTIAPGRKVTVGRCHGNAVTGIYRGLSRSCAPEASGDSLGVILLEADRDTTAIPFQEVAWVLKRRATIPVLLAFLVGATADVLMVMNLTLGGGD
jgi:hypothetical protein